MRIFSAGAARSSGTRTVPQRARSGASAHWWKVSRGAELAAGAATALITGAARSAFLTRAA
jgi:hypothetical protein